MAEPSQTSTEPTSTWQAYFWPGFVVALLSGHVLLLLAMVYIAVSDRSFAVEPDYYQQGLHWDDIAAQQRRNAELGWHISIDFGDPAGPLAKRELRCLLTDRDGSPLEDALIDLIAFPHSRGTQRELVMLEPVGEGLYAASMRFQKKGLWEFRFVVRQDSSTFTYVEQKDVYPPGESRPWQH